MNNGSVSPGRNLLRIFTIIFIIEVMLSFYRTVDNETRKGIRRFLKRETRFFRESVEKIINYFVVTSDLIAEQDIVDIESEQNKVNKKNFSFFIKFIEILTMRLFKMCKMMFKTTFYPVKLFFNLILIGYKSALVFAKGLYTDICYKLTNAAVWTFTLLYRMFRFVFSFVRFACDFVEEIFTFIDIKLHSFV